MKRVVFCAFLLSACAAASPELDAGEIDDAELVETQTEALTITAPSGGLAQVNAPPGGFRLDPAVLARLHLPSWVRTCGDAAPIPERFVARIPGCRAIRSRGGSWTGRPVADGRAADICEMSWSPFTLSFRPPGGGGSAPPPEPPDYEALEETVDLHAFRVAPDKIVALCGTSSAATSSAFAPRSVVASAVLDRVPAGMAGCGACAFASGGNLYATLPADWTSSRVRFLFGARHVDIAPAGAQLVMVPGVGATGPVGVERVQ
jgi:hypothetical protein